MISFSLVDQANRTHSKVIPTEEQNCDDGPKTHTPSYESLHPPVSLRVLTKDQNRDTNQEDDEALH